MWPGRPDCSGCHRDETIHDEWCWLTPLPALSFSSFSLSSPESLQQISHLPLTLSSATSFPAPTNIASPFMTFINLLFVLPLAPLSGRSILSILLLIYSLSLHTTVYVQTISICPLTSKIAKHLPSNVLIPELIHLCHFQREPQHFHLPTLSFVFCSSSSLLLGGCWRNQLGARV